GWTGPPRARRPPRATTRSRARSPARANRGPGCGGTTPWTAPGAGRAAWRRRARARRGARRRPSTRCSQGNPTDQSVGRRGAHPFAPCETAGAVDDRRRDDTRRQDDAAEVERLLGRPPRGDWEVVARHPDGSPLVIRNAPLLDDGTPMPTRYWLVGEPERTLVSQLESDGGVAAAEAAVDPDELAAAHARYAAERDAALPPDHTGPRPSGGVGGTRKGVKCLHAHYAWFLAGGDDPVGRWVHEQLAARRQVASGP